MVKNYTKEEIREQKFEFFKKIINKRLRNALAEIEKIGKCSDTSRYYYEKKHVYTLFNSLNTTLRDQRRKYDDGLRKVSNTSSDVDIIQ